MKFKITFLFIALAINASDCVAQEGVGDSTNEIVLPSEIKWQPLNPKRGKDGPRAGTLFKGSLHSHGSTFRAVVIEGQAGYQTSGEAESKTLEPGSYFGGKGESIHRISSSASGESVIYIHTDGNYELVSE